MAILATLDDSLLVELLFSLEALVDSLSLEIEDIKLLEFDDKDSDELDSDVLETNK